MQVRVQRWHIKYNTTVTISIQKLSNECKSALARQENEDAIFNGRMISTPIMGIMGIFSAPLILVANVSLDVKDRLSASGMSETCGGEAIENTKIAQDVP